MVETINGVLKSIGSKFSTEDGYTLCMYIGHLTFLKKTFETQEECLEFVVNIAANQQEIDGGKEMTKEIAQEIVENQGFAWTVTEVIENYAFTLIYCDWNGKEHTMYYSNESQEVVKIIQKGKFRTVHRADAEIEGICLLQCSEMERENIYVKDKVKEYVKLL